MNNLDQINKLGNSMFPTEEFNELLEEFLGKEVEILEEMNEKNKNNNELTQLLPKLFIVLNKKSPEEKREIVVAGLMMDSSIDTAEKRKKMMQTVGKDLAKKKLQVVGAYFSSEVWVATEEKGMNTLKKDAEGNILPPSEQPMKQEAVMVFGKTIDNRNNFAQIVYKKINNKLLFFENQKTVHKYQEGDKDRLDAPLLDNLFISYLNELKHDFATQIKDQ